MDQAILEYIPHRPPMLLINRLISVSETVAVAAVDINQSSAFFVAGRGVPVIIGLEYMGQTAALIAGYQRQQGLCDPHLGFLLGSRKFTAEREWYAPNEPLTVRCEQVAVVANSLATFACTITADTEAEGAVIIARANLSVMRKPIADAVQQQDTTQ